MSELGDEIRHQRDAAHRVAHALDDDARDVRSHLRSTVWESGAGRAFRDTLSAFAEEIDAAHRQVEQLARDIGHHADVVERHEETVHDIVTWPARLVGLA